jgi:hypothetical protein
VKTREYTVLPGDTLRAIAVRLYGDASRWLEIAQLNGLRPPHIIDSIYAADRLDDTVIWNDVILVPQALIENPSPPEQIFGSDVSMSRGDFVLSDGDLATCIGIGN